MFVKSQVSSAKWPKEPILPGKSDMISVTYNAAHAGSFNKSITITSNAKTPTKVIYIKGSVDAAPVEPQSWIPSPFRQQLIVVNVLFFRALEARHSERLARLHIAFSMDRAIVDRLFCNLQYIRRMTCSY